MPSVAAAVLEVPRWVADCMASMHSTAQHRITAPSSAGTLSVLATQFSEINNNNVCLQE
jgi:hypothetical protein